MFSAAPLSKSSESTLTKELRALAAKWSPHPIEREAFATDFQSVKIEMIRQNDFVPFVFSFKQELKKLVDWLSLDDIERLCADRLNPITWRIALLTWLGLRTTLFRSSLFSFSNCNVQKNPTLDRFRHSRRFSKGERRWIIQIHKCRIGSENNTLSHWEIEIKVSQRERRIRVWDWFWKWADIVIEVDVNSMLIRLNTFLSMSTSVRYYYCSKYRETNACHPSSHICKPSLNELVEFDCRRSIRLWESIDRLERNVYPIEGEEFERFVFQETTPPTWKPRYLLRICNNAHPKTIRLPRWFEIIDYRPDDDSQRHQSLVQSHCPVYPHTNLDGRHYPSRPRRYWQAVTGTFRPCHKRHYPETIWSWNSSSFCARLYIHLCPRVANEHDSVDDVNSTPCIHPSKSKPRQTNTDAWTEQRLDKGSRQQLAYDWCDFDRDCHHEDAYFDDVVLDRYDPRGYSWPCKEREIGRKSINVSGRRTIPIVHHTSKLWSLVRIVHLTRHRWSCVRSLQKLTSPAKRENRWFQLLDLCRVQIHLPDFDIRIIATQFEEPILFDRQKATSMLKTDGWGAKNFYRRFTVGLLYGSVWYFIRLRSRWGISVSL